MSIGQTAKRSPNRQPSKKEPDFNPVLEVKILRGNWAYQRLIRRVEAKLQEKKDDFFKSEPEDRDRLQHEIKGYEECLNDWKLTVANTINSRTE